MKPYSKKDDVINVNEISIANCSKTDGNAINIDEINDSNTATPNDDSSSTSSSYFSVVLNDETSTTEADFDLAFGNTRCVLYKNTTYLSY